MQLRSYMFLFSFVAIASCKSVVNQEIATPQQSVDESVRTCSQGDVVSLDQIMREYNAILVGEMH